MTNAVQGSATSETVLSPPLKAPWSRWLIGIAPNRAHQSHNSTVDFPDFTLSVVEFDDQGRCYDRVQMQRLEERLETLKTKNPVIIVFVHGWRHNGSSSDDDLKHFYEMTEFTAQAVVAQSQHTSESTSTKSGTPRPVLAVFLAWRGLSFYGCPLELPTFWGRKRASLRVAMGASRELFERLRQFRNDEGGKTTLAIIGHSFGGLIVFSALAQSLIQSANSPANHVAPAFADLVLLVNPAFEAVRYLPLHDLVRERHQRSQNVPQLPVFISVTAKNDLATKWAFKIGMITSLCQSFIGPKERRALDHTMGHLNFMRTHELTMTPASTIEGSVAREACVRFCPNNPFWVVSATPDVINGHNGIWQKSFRDWIIGRILDRVLK